MYRFGFITCLLAVVICGCLVLNAVEITPVANVSLLGGQYFLKSDQGTFGGNLDIFYTPVINFSPETALLPIFTVAYRGTKDVQELVGGGTLTQEYADLGLSMKYVRKFSDTLKGKARIGYKLEYLKETKDEDWTEGLFDYNKLIYGIEIEKLMGASNVRAGYDYYGMSYPNYSSLVSQYSTTIDTTTYKEISQDAGENVLDYNTNELFIEVTRKLSDTTVGKLSYDVASKSFVDQSVVDDKGKFSTTLRNDLVHYLNGNANFKLNERKSLTLGGSILYYTSNQNSYDASNIKFIPNFYGFSQISITPSVTFKLGDSEPYRFLTGYCDIASRQYQDRFTQDSAGEYLTDKVNQLTTTLGLGYTYPIPNYKGLVTKFSANYRSVSSNMKYEKNYKYNYYVTNYFLGLEWSY